ncbi:protoporphyrinogen oxidase HemJ [uncultured Rhodoblastus sp.]|uniref:protoporphyrinogen oxidase HemJ n=1 Tax=uncultured Rhodoblastus sp. TaxID=543037 RepID=UPI0025E0694C|nr:protoporphyrinogen oxidase HemJ [uncultured Rhodoblastus sp.]
MYLWVKVVHVVAIISWMAGLLYLPRLFVYHCAAETGGVQSETFKIMERRLLKAIMTPAMIAAWATGLWLASEAAFFKDPWFHVKLALVLGLTAAHWHFAGLRQNFERDDNRHSSRYFRIWNEIPTIMMIFIVIMVIVKPIF